MTVTLHLNSNVCRAVVPMNESPRAIAVGCIFSVSSLHIFLLTRTQHAGAFWVAAMLPGKTPRVLDVFLIA